MNNEYVEKMEKLDKLRNEFRKHRMPDNDDDYIEWCNLHKEKHDELAHKIFKLSKEIKDMRQRDSKGRFVSTNVTGNNETNKVNLKKENDTMNKTNAKEMRMETLKDNGVNTNNFFDLSMRVPFGAEIKIVVDGQEMIVPANKSVVCDTTCGKTDNVVTAAVYGNHVIGSGLIDYCAGTPTFVTSNGDVCDAETGEVLVMANDPIAERIINDGYVKNSKLFRRYVLAHTFKLLEYVDRKNSYRKGWEAGFKDMYGYGYQFEMLADELHTLAKLQKEDPEYFAERTKFFNGDVVVATLSDYFYRLKKYCNKQMRNNPRKYRGELYVKLARYGNVLAKDLNAKVYGNILTGIANVKIAVREGNYRDIEKAFNDFMNKLYNKLPYETPKCAVFKDAYKGIGAFESLKNMVRFHNVIINGCTNKYDSEARLYTLLNGEYRNKTWKFHGLLVDTIEYNKFNLRQSIANGHAAPNTTSEKADKYRR